VSALEAALDFSFGSLIDPQAKRLRVVNQEIAMAIVETAKFRQNSTHRPLRAIAYSQAGLVDFTTEFPGGVTFKMVSGATTVTGTATGDANGNLTYAWAPTDLAVPGTYAATFTAVGEEGLLETMPSGTNLEIVVVPTI
jgi:hypothetical protein